MFGTVLAAGGAIDPKNLLETFGVIGLFAIIFAETGLLIGFFLPGDSLLVLAGLVSAVGAKSDLDVKVNIVLVIAGPVRLGGGRGPDRVLHRTQGRPRALPPARLEACSSTSTSRRRSTTSTTTDRGRSWSRASSPSCAPSPTRWRASPACPCARSRRSTSSAARCGPSASRCSASCSARRSRAPRITSSSSRP